MNKKQTTGFFRLLALGRAARDRRGSQCHLRRALLYGVRLLARAVVGADLHGLHLFGQHRGGTSTVSAIISSTIRSSSGSRSTARFRSCSRSRSASRRSRTTRSTRGTTAAIATSPEDGGDTIDWVSIYRHSHDHDDAESVWTYTFLSYLRDDPIAIIKELYVKDEKEAVWGVVEIVGFMAFYIAIVFCELEVHALLHSVLLPRPLPLVSQRLLPALRRRHGAAHRVGG